MSLWKQGWFYQILDHKAEKPKAQMQNKVFLEQFIVMNEKDNNLPLCNWILQSFFTIQLLFTSSTSINKTEYWSQDEKSALHTHENYANGNIWTASLIFEI